MKYLLALLAMLAGTLSGTAVQAAPASEEEAYEIGLDAYTYGYPMVLMDTTRLVSTNAGAPGRLRAPMNDFSHMRTYPDATFKDVVRPNADTLYSSLWYDVGKDPLVLTLPKTAGRYHVVPIMDMWTEDAHHGQRRWYRRAGRSALAGQAAPGDADGAQPDRHGVDHRAHPDQRPRRLRPCPQPAGGL